MMILMSDSDTECLSRMEHIKPQLTGTQDRTL